MQTMSATAQAGANIAITKYWGNLDIPLCIPANDSISLTLDRANTLTTVSFSSEFERDEVVLGDSRLEGPAFERVTRHIDLFRDLAGVDWRARVVSENSFPAAAGIASSASAFAALSLACAEALGLDLGARELSCLARRGSGSAARSVFGGFVLLHAGPGDEQACAEPLYAPDWWEVCDLVVVLSRSEKQVSSLAGHRLAPTSPLYQARLERVPVLNERLRRALEERDLTVLGEVAEEDALLMHSVMMTSQPALFYWLPQTVALIQQVYTWRAEGVEVYFTIDAGPNIHLLTLPQHVDTLMGELQANPAIQDVILCRPGRGVRRVDSRSEKT